jgi:hypothetical protein
MPSRFSSSVIYDVQNVTIAEYPSTSTRIRCVECEWKTVRISYPEKPKEKPC